MISIHEKSPPCKTEQLPKLVLLIVALEQLSSGKKKKKLISVYLYNFINEISWYSCLNFYNLCFLKIKHFSIAKVQLYAKTRKC